MGALLIIILVGARFMYLTKQKEEQAYYKNSCPHKPDWDSSPCAYDDCKFCN